MLELLYNISFSKIQTFGNQEVQSLGQHSSNLYISLLGAGNGNRELAVLAELIIAVSNGRKLNKLW